ncbi:E3 ubiquitin-protein ligase At3g02290-like isoform X2 [Phalaenopsis equestris]|uniref:E3 ubiquitin-protein ligase At3g02290-like isoform X2 n=1 Tax=Phalaenopsis equestris TaxID=78828 RepID=UPI0009E514D2|nr:E3 ubiquitin-protein ligase At3g02290-like isoform X2 [Phalaenopsis equestris]
MVKAVSFLAFVIFRAFSATSLASAAVITTSADASLTDTHPLVIRPTFESDGLHSRSQRDGLISRREQLGGAKKRNNANGEEESKVGHFEMENNPSAKAYVLKSLEDEDVCPTCLEEYNPENPKIKTKCSHHFHLSCIYEWMERSDSCPICGKEMELCESP